MNPLFALGLLCAYVVLILAAVVLALLGATTAQLVELVSATHAIGLMVLAWFGADHIVNHPGPGGQ